MQNEAVQVGATVAEVSSVSELLFLVSASFI